MGYTPERFACDFCTNEIKRGDKRVTIEVPMTRAERHAIADEWERGGTPKPMTMLGQIVSWLALVPTEYTIVACVPCINNILPDVVGLRRKNVEERVAQIRADRARREQAEAEEVND